MEMKRTRRWVISVVAGAAAVVVLALGISSQLSTCAYRETSPAYSPDGKFYSQMQFTLCEDHPKSRARLVVGSPGKQEKAVILDLGPDIGELHLSWYESPGLHVRVPASAITRRYGPYPDLPPVVIANP